MEDGTQHDHDQRRPEQEQDLRRQPVPVARLGRRPRPLGPLEVDDGGEDEARQAGGDAPRKVEDVPEGFALRREFSGAQA